MSASIASIRDMYNWISFMQCWILMEDFVQARQALYLINQNPSP